MSKNDFTPEDLAFLKDLAQRTWDGEAPKLVEPILERFGSEAENKPKVMAAFMVITDYIDVFADMLPRRIWLGLEEFASEGK